MKIDPSDIDFAPSERGGSRFASVTGRWVLPGVLGVLPVVFVRGIDDFTALPRLILLQILLLVCLPMLIWHRRPVRSPFILPASVLLLLMALSALSAINPVRSVLSLSRYCTLFLLLWALVAYVRREHLLTLCVSVTLGGLLVTLIGLAEYLGYVVSWIPTTGRPSTTLGFRNLAAGYLIAAIPFAGALAFAARASLTKVFGAGTAALMLVLLLYTRTRGAWVGFAAAAGSCTVLWLACGGRGRLAEIWENYGKLRTLVPAAFCLILILATGSLEPRFRETHVQRLDEKKTELSEAVTGILRQGWDRGRFTLWSLTMEMILDHPIRGVGLGNWEFLYPSYAKGALLTGTANPRHPHSDPLWIWAELGTFGLLAYLWLLATAIYQACRIWRGNTASVDSWMAFCFLLSIFAVAGHGMFSFPWDRIVPIVLTFAGFAGLSCLAPVENPGVRHTNRTRWSAGLGTVVVAGGLTMSVQKTLFDYHYIRAMSAFRQKNFPAQVQEAARALETGPFHHQAFTLLADGLIGTEHYKEARAVLRKGLRYHPYFMNSFNSMGLAWDKEGNLEKAIDFYRQAVQIAPLNRLTRYNLGTVLQRLGKEDSAMVVYKKAGSAAFTQPWVNLASIYAERGQWDSVIVMAEKALTGPKPSYAGYIHLGRALAHAGRLREAIIAYEGYISKEPEAAPEFSDAVRIELADAYGAFGVRAEQEGLREQSLGAYQSAVELKPEDPIHHYNLGNALRRDQRIAEAIASYRRALGLDSTLVGARHNLAITYHARGMLREAEEAFTQALRHTDGPAEAALVWNESARTYAGLGNKPMAIRAYIHVVDEWMDDPRAIRSASDNLLALGDTTAAIRGYERFLAAERLDQMEAANIRLKLRRLRN